ncbi:hypothetical protein B0H19DRAFT_936467, partial [Mycena capillaripes]
MSNNILYTRAILSQGEGYPLFLPPPSNDLPEPARRTGTEIGDIVVANHDGSIDVLFNILRPPDDRANRFGVPSGFIQAVLPPNDVRMQLQCYPPGYVISNTTVKRKHLGLETGLDSMHVYPCMPMPLLLPIGAGAVFEVSTNVNEMGLIILPDGASSWDARSMQIFHDYALKHGRSWYAWVNGDLGRMVRNGSLYLVTGVTKSTSW